MELKSQDIYVALKLIAIGKQRWTYGHLSADLYISASETNSAVKRAIAACLIREPLGGERNPQPIVPALEEFIFHGIRYSFPPVVGALVRGVPTGFSAPSQSGDLLEDGQPPHVWPWEHGSTRGLSFTPLYKTAPQAVQLDTGFYELLTLVDCIRESSSRGRQVAELKLRAKFAAYARQ